MSFRIPLPRKGIETLCNQTGGRHPGDTFRIPLPRKGIETKIMQTYKREVTRLSAYLYPARGLKLYHTVVPNLPFGLSAYLYPARGLKLV